MRTGTKQEVVSTRIELDQQFDLDLQRMAAIEIRSKRQMGAVIIRRVARIWKENPDILIQNRIIQPNA